MRPEAGSYTVEARGVRYQELVAPFYLRNFKVTGRLSGRGELTLDGAFPAGARGSLEAELTEGTVRNLFVQGMVLPDFAFDTVRLRGRLEGALFTVEELSLKSEIFDGTLQGTCRVDPRDLRESSLDLTARLTPRPGDPVNLRGVASFLGKEADAGGAYVFALAGTLRRPRVE